MTNDAVNIRNPKSARAGPQAATSTTQWIYSSGLRGQSRENGSFLEFDWRFSGMLAQKVRTWVSRDY
jgi:hypothetical protein